MTPRISFIVSAHSRPEHLRLCLQSLDVQTIPDWEAIVTDSASDDVVALSHKVICSEFSRVRYVRTPPELRIDCYYSSEYALPLTSGEWLCFPSDDSYYVPCFAEKVLAMGADCDLVVCDFVWGRTVDGRVEYSYREAAPQVCFVDKTTFVIRRDRMIPWPQKNPNGVPTCCDGLLVEAVAASGARVSRMTDLLVVHN